MPSLLIDRRDLDFQLYDVLRVQDLTARDRFAECDDRGGLGDEVRVLDPDPLPGEADRGVVQHFHRRRRAFRFDERGMDEQVAFWYIFRYVVMRIGNADDPNRWLL